MHAQFKRAIQIGLNPARRQYLAMTRQGRSGPKVLANSVPKSGTHLLDRCLSLFPNMANYHKGVYVMNKAGLIDNRSMARVGGDTYVMAHLGYTADSDAFLQQHQFKSVIMVRDPRDIVISYHKFALRKTRHPQHALFAALPDEQARLRFAIAGDVSDGTPPLVLSRLERMVPWVDHGSHLVRFEDLVGERGGGDREAQLATIRNLATYLEIPVTDSLIVEIADSVFSSKSRTFRKGTIQQWRDTFSAEDVALFKQSFGSKLLIELGYEQDENWGN